MLSLHLGVKKDNTHNTSDCDLFEIFSQNEVKLLLDIRKNKI